MGRQGRPRLLDGFNSRTPGGVRLNNRQTRVYISTVSIHAPREGCDRRGLRLFASKPSFQFTHPGRGATTRLDAVRPPAGVSIHAPREGCDLMEITLQSSGVVSIHAPREGCDYTFVLGLGRLYRFNSRTPGGVRLIHLVERGLS